MRKTLIWLATLVLLSVFLILASCAPPKYEKLSKFIETTRFIDVHSHPVAGKIMRNNALRLHGLE